jgi:RNA polymerase sigma-70 factor (ECF subfamily)
VQAMDLPPLRRSEATGAESSERGLLRRIATQDRTAMREFYLLYHRRLARFLMRITPRFDLAEEIINDTMLIVWQQAPRFRGESRVSTWVMGIAYRQGLRSLRTRMRADARAVGPELVEDAADSQEAEHRDWLGKGLAGLSTEHRLALELTYYGGYSCEEIATIMNCPVNTVKTRMFYAREKLRSVLPGLATPGGSAS